MRFMDTTCVQWDGLFPKETLPWLWLLFMWKGNCFKWSENYSESGQGCLTNLTPPTPSPRSWYFLDQIRRLYLRAMFCCMAAMFYGWTCLFSRLTESCRMEPRIYSFGMCCEKPHNSKDICLPCCNITDYCRLSRERSLPNQPGSLWNKCISLLCVNDSAPLQNFSLLTLSICALWKATSSSCRDLLLGQNRFGFWPFFFFFLFCI